MSQLRWHQRVFVEGSGAGGGEMAHTETTIELAERYCPSCKFDTQHAIRTVSRRGYPLPEEINTACGVCNGDAFWALRLGPLVPEAASTPEPVNVLPGVT